jgi:hypothetical protein
MSVDLSCLFYLTEHTKRHIETSQIIDHKELNKLAEKNSTHACIIKILLDSQ